MAITDPVLRKFRAALDEVYGERIERVVLYGSRARGDARPDSDYDVAVFLTPRFCAKFGLWTKWRCAEFCAKKWVST
jgi:predicted nucleotidyltransferase